MKLDYETKSCFDRTEKLFGDISLIIKLISKKNKQKVHVIFLCDYFLVYDNECQSIFSRSMIRKIFSLLNSQYINREGRLKLNKAIRSLSEHICIDFYLHHQNPGRKHLIGSDKIRRFPWYRIPTRSCWVSESVGFSGFRQDPGHSDTFRHPTTSCRNPIPGFRQLPTNSHRIR